MAYNCTPLLPFPLCKNYSIVKLRQGSARNGSQGERPQSLNPCLELTLKLGHLRLTIDYLKATVVHIRVTLGHLKVTIGYFFLSANIRQTQLSFTPK